MNDFKEITGMFLSILFLALLTILLVLGPVVGLVSYSNYQVCETLQQENFNPELSYHWDFWTGCMVRIPDGTLISVNKMYYGNEKLMIEGLEE